MSLISTCLKIILEGTELLPATHRLNNRLVCPEYSKSAQDVKTLLKQVSDIVFDKTGIRLEPEIRIW